MWDLPWISISGQSWLFNLNAQNYSLSNPLVPCQHTNMWHYIVQIPVSVHCVFSQLVIIKNIGLLYPYVNKPVLFNKISYRVFWVSVWEWCHQVMLCSMCFQCSTELKVLAYWKVRSSLNKAPIKLMMFSKWLSENHSFYLCGVCEEKMMLS